MDDVCEWRQAVERRGPKFNLWKEMRMVTGSEMDDVIQVGRYPCGVCGRSDGANSVLCETCGKWCYGRCSCLWNLSGVFRFRYPACARGGAGEAVGMSWDVVGEVKQFYYVGDMLQCSVRLVQKELGLHLL